MKILNAITNIEKLYDNGNFNIERWKVYIEEVLPNLGNILIEDIKNYSFEKMCLPIINLTYREKEKRAVASNSFDTVSNNLEEKILSIFKKPLDVDIILYLGLCNGAGWVTTVNNQTKILLGIEKIIELDWCKPNDMIGLIYHELGHVYQDTYGTFKRKFDNISDKYLWQLFTEGIAMCFEQILVGDMNFFHQDKADWLTYMDKSIETLKNDFTKDLPQMDKNQRYFGDWVSYNGYTDAGYYLGARFVQFILKNNTFDEIINFDIEQVKTAFNNFI